MNNPPAKLDVTIKFIENIKDNFKAAIDSGEIPTMPRIDENIYFHELEEQEILFSFSN